MSPRKGLVLKKSQLFCSDIVSEGRDLFEMKGGCDEENFIPPASSESEDCEKQ